MLLRVTMLYKGGVCRTANSRRACVGYSTPLLQRRETTSTTSNCTLVTLTHVRRSGFIRRCATIIRAVDSWNKLVLRNISWNSLPSQCPLSHTFSFISIHVILPWRICLSLRSCARHHCVLRIVCSGMVPFVCFSPPGSSEPRSDKPLRAENSVSKRNRRSDSGSSSAPESDDDSECADPADGWRSLPHHLSSAEVWESLQQEARRHAVRCSLCQQGPFVFGSSVVRSLCVFKVSYVSRKVSTITEQERTNYRI